ncbi:MAG: arsenic resistance protein [Vulcanibacillus sp.]
MTNLFKFISNYLIVFIIGSIILGLIYGIYLPTDNFKSFVYPVLFFMIYPMMINLDILCLGAGFKNFKPVGISLLINYTISPLIAIILANIFFSGSIEFAIGIYLISLLPTSGMTVAWTGLAKGNIMTALILVSFNLLLSIILLPIYMNFILDSSVSIDTMKIIEELIKIVVIPMVLGDLTRRFILKKWGKETFNKKVKPNLSGFSSIGVVLLIFFAIALKSKNIVSNWDQALIGIFVMGIYYVIILIISHVIGKKFLSYGDAIALVYSTAARDLTIALGIAIILFKDSVLLIAVAYIVQAPLSAMYLKFIQKGQKNSDSELT